MAEAGAHGGVLRAYARANRDAIASALSGWGPDASTADPAAGPRVVANIPAVHVPSFVARSRAGDPRPYTNAYDNGKYRIGDLAAAANFPTRVLVDRALPFPPGKGPQDVYFCAVELNGAGIRFYGDMTLVLRSDRVAADTTILDRNSYDLVREPMKTWIDRAGPGRRIQAMRERARDMSGRWHEALVPMVAIRVFEKRGVVARRLTTGQISDAVLDDEDYIEVLRIGSFGVADLQEARLSAADVALDAMTADRLRHGPVPRFEAILWRARRRRAEKALGGVGVRTAVVVSSGRVKS
jgi:hypothetical protein